MKLYFILAAILIALIVGAIGGYYFCKSGIPAQLTDQQTTDKKLCEQDQQVTKEANDALQKDRDDVASQLDALKLQHPAACVCPTGTTDVPSHGAKHAETHGTGVSSDWLRDYAAQCETYRGEVGVCVSFLADERKLIQPDAQ